MKRRNYKVTVLIWKKGTSGVITLSRIVLWIKNITDDNCASKLSLWGFSY